MPGAGHKVPAGWELHFQCGTAECSPGIVFVTPHHKQSRCQEQSKHSPSQITEPVDHYFMSWKAEVVVLVLRGFLCLFWAFSPQTGHSMLLPGLKTQLMTEGSTAEFISGLH